MSAIQRAAVSTRDMAVKTASFWKMENLSSAFLKQAQEGQSLRDPALPVEIRPIAHCGMGIAAVELADFSPERLKQIIEPFSRPEYRLFAYEGSGAMLALYQPDLFGWMARTTGKIGLLPMADFHYPDPRAFTGAFEPEIRRLISYGFGRMLYFKHGGIGGAIRAAGQVDWLEVPQAVQGIAFAYAMVNNSDLGNVLRAGQRLQPAPAGRAFTDGLIYALEFWEWMAPGFLAGRAASNPYEAALMRAARDGVDAGLERGALAPFALEPYKPRE